MCGQFFNKTANHLPLLSVTEPINFTSKPISTAGNYKNVTCTNLSHTQISNKILINHLMINWSLLINYSDTML